MRLALCFINICFRLQTQEDKMVMVSTGIQILVAVLTMEVSLQKMHFKKNNFKILELSKKTCVNQSYSHKLKYVKINIQTTRYLYFVLLCVSVQVLRNPLLLPYCSPDFLYILNTCFD